MRYECALADLEKKCADRKATHEDFQRIRNLVILNGRATQPSGADAGQATTLDALDRIERRASLGPVSKEDFQSLRRSAPATTTIPPKIAPVTSAVNPPATTGPADLRRKSQPPKLEPVPRPAPTPAPRPQPDRTDKDKPERTHP